MMPKSIHNFKKMNCLSIFPGRLGRIRHPPRSNKVLETALQILVQISPIFPFVISLIVILLDMDPLYVLGDVWQPKRSHLILIPLRFFILSWIFSELAKSFFGFATSGLILMTPGPEIIARCKNALESFNNSLIKVLMVYKELQIWNRYCNENFCYFACPPIAFFGSCTMILANYLTVRPGMMPLVIYWGFPATSFLGFAILATIVPEAALL